MESVWSAECELPRFPALETDLSTDTLIIGGGMAGILCAHMLQKAGVDTVLVEATSICGGITKNTTAKITAQHGLIYHRLLRQFGFEKTRLYYKANQEALKAFHCLCRDVDCDFSLQDSYVYAPTNRAKLEQEAAALRALGIPATLVETTELPFPVAGAVKFARQAQFHPLKFLRAMVPELKIFENTAVRELAPHIAVTDRGTIRAKNIIVATHFPMLNKHGSYFLKLYQHRSYVLALENAATVNGMYVDESDKGLSLRSYGSLLLLGGGGHRTGKKGGTWRELEAFTKKHYPDAVIRHRWATQDCMSLDGVPYIGPYSRRTEGLYVATGFNKWGMTSSMVAARLLTDQIQGKENPYAALFSPSRSILRPQLAVNGWEATVNLLTPTTKRCPHLGCALKWNPQEHSWDCPCHGSRFTADGKLIDGPASGDLPK
jgi:glycine/D-amino acid oxidase-like deaminating enzyme